jgi:hypothetical protein
MRIAVTVEGVPSVHHLGEAGDRSAKRVSLLDDLI